jgi:protein-L-isoaspartate(D-aspartate) O-methyltransferase
MGALRLKRGWVFGLVFAFLFSLLFFSTLSLGADEYYKARKEMVEWQLKDRGISDEKVLLAMETVPRHLFVPKFLMGRAYSDYALSIGYGQTISQPYVVALMTEMLGLKPDWKVLEIGTGSGYQAAILSLIVKEVYTIEIRTILAGEAKKRLFDLGYKNVSVKSGDGYFGWEDKAPFDAIIITCAVNHIPPPLLSQLKEGGKLVLPLGNPAYFQNLTLVTKTGEDFIIDYKMTGFVFVPMTGEAEKRR